MKKWVFHMLIVVVLFILAASGQKWLPLFLGFVDTQGNRIQTLADLVQLVLWVLAAIGLWFGVRRFGKRKQPQRSGLRTPDGDNTGGRNASVSGNVSRSILTTGSRNVAQQGKSNVNITVNQESSPRELTVEVERAKAERIRAETDAKVIDHLLSLLKQNESPLTGRLGQNTGINASERLPCQSEKFFFREEYQAQATDDTPKISLPHDSLPPARQTPGVEQAEEIAEQLSDHWSVSSAERDGLPPLSDAQKWSPEATGQQYLVKVKKLMGELEIGQAIDLLQELEPWLESNSQSISTSLASNLYYALFEIKGKQVRRASSDADRRAYLAEADLLLRKARDVFS